MRIIGDANEQAELQRKEIATHLREIADQVESSPKTPIAMFTQVYWADLEITRSKNIFQGFNLLNALACFELLKAEIIDEIRA
jgi:hypothetical protein